MKSIYWIALMAILLICSFYLLGEVAEAGSTQSFIRQHWIEIEEVDSE